MKKILFVIESLVCAGAEKSLVTLLNLIDYSKYEVDLQLFAYGGEFEEMLPKEVNLLPPLPYYESTSESLRAVIKRKKTLKEWKYFRGRLKYSFRLRIGKFNNPQKAVIFWQSVQNCFDVAEKEYDVAIAYAQGTPTFYVADCVKAKKKFAWVNSIYTLKWNYREYALAKYLKLDEIVCVSEAGRKVFEETFPILKEKTNIIYDINDGKMIAKMASAESSANKEMEAGKVKILTIGRLAIQKGYDIAIQACRILKNKNIDFCWYVLGKGALEKEIIQKIDQYDIGDKFILLGTRANPYSYLKLANIYVQTSRFEGFGLAIAEARMLNTPVVTTRFDAVYAQMVEDENGLVVDMNGQAVADAIQRLINEPELYNHIVEYQKQEKKGNYEELEKFYEQIEAE